MFGAEFMFTQPARRLAARGWNRVITSWTGPRWPPAPSWSPSGYPPAPADPGPRSARRFRRVDGAAGVEAPPWPATTSTSWAGPTPPARPPCTWPVRRPGHPADPRRLTGSPHVRLPRHPDRGGAHHRRQTPHPPRRRPRSEPPRRPTLEDIQTRRRNEVPAAAVFILIGAAPHTRWLRNAVRQDDHGFVLTGTDVPPDEWPATRAPLPFESSLPGVFAAGDVRHGSVERVAGSPSSARVRCRRRLRPPLPRRTGRLQPDRTLTALALLDWVGRGRRVSLRHRLRVGRGGVSANRSGRVASGAVQGNSRTGPDMGTCVEAVMFGLPGARRDSGARQATGRAAGGRACPARPARAQPRTGRLRRRPHRRRSGASTCPPTPPTPSRSECRNYAGPSSRPASRATSSSSRAGLPARRRAGRHRRPPVRAPPDPRPAAGRGR